MGPNDRSCKLDSVHFGLFLGSGLKTHYHSTDSVILSVLHNWAKRNIFFLDSIWARWKCAQCVDLIQGFLELVGNPPENKNSESYGLRRPSLDLAGASCNPSHFLYFSFCFFLTSVLSVILSRLCVLVKPTRLGILGTKSIWTEIWKCIPFKSY